MRRLLILSLVLLWPLSASAELFVCGDAVAAYPTPAFTGSVSLDPSKAPATMGGKPCYAIPKAETASQQTLIQSHPAHDLQVVSARVAVLGQAEQDAWDAARQAVTEQRQALQDEANDPTVCAHLSEADLEQKFETLRTNLAGDPTDTARFSRLVNVLEKITKCLWSLRKLSGR